MVKHLTLSAAAALVLLVGGCRKNEVSIEMFGLCSMPDNCTFGGTCGSLVIDTPLIDVTGAAADGDAMWLAVEVHNQLDNNADPESGRVNTHDAMFESYSLSFSGPRPSAMPATLSDIPATAGHASQVIPANGTAVIGFEPVPLSLIESLAAGTTPAGPNYDEVTVSVTFKGKVKDGSHWETSLDVPVRICHDCVSAVCSDATQVPISACPSLHQSPAGAPTCTKPPPSCLASGTFCGSNPGVANGDASTLYLCTAAGASPANSNVCANGCDDTITPNVCKP
jgi:hypothetical protein